ncbi:RNA-binding protein, putative [Eimeria tenella]|uniref:RNA-binding protein, putative n=1 Tax=Eimeria tenella TaxID=5802 RepID=U6KYU6_EIMTE|nr:RNA-binding protein, putative [Eimeria tenella]CDJ42103.1 RNA-binding protein, putative [Eimeria tenella]|eukprot:XP_013232853.1 RNA-binding protein, putative [Eimeria tenella]
MKRSLQLLKTALRAQQQQRKTKKGRKQQQSEQQNVQNGQQLRDSQQDQLQRKKLHQTEKESEHSSDANDKTSKVPLVLFVGNLPLSVSAQEVKEFFGRKLQLFIKDVRLLTEKDTGASKGCGFVEFTNKEALQIALNYDGRTLSDRKIRVELTAGGRQIEEPSRKNKKEKPRYEKTQGSTVEEEERENEGKDRRKDGRLRRCPVGDTKA